MATDARMKLNDISLMIVDIKTINTCPP